MALIPEIPPVTYDLIKYYEGCYLTPYKDPVGYWTVGYGHLLTLDKNAPQPPKIDRTEALAFLASDVAQTAQNVCSLILAPCRANLFAALVDFTFNMGSGRLKASTLLRKVNNQESQDDIIQELGKWDKAGGKVLVGLKRRRAAEAMVILTGGFDPKQVDDYMGLFS